MLKNPKVSFGTAALKNLVKTPNSCVNLKPACKRTVVLLPSHLGDFKSSLKGILESKVTSYDEDLDGIVLGQKNVKVIDLVQVEDSGHISVEIIADIYIFQPKIGCTLKGIVNKKGGDHISCLVHNVFNCVIPRPLDSKSPWKGSTLKLGQEIDFNVEKLDFSRQLPYLRGVLFSVVSSEENRDEIDSGIGCLESAEEEKLSKKHKKKKHRHKTEEEEVEKIVQDEDFKNFGKMTITEDSVGEDGFRSPSSIKGILKISKRDFNSPSKSGFSGSPKKFENISFPSYEKLSAKVSSALEESFSSKKREDKKSVNNSFLLLSSEKNTEDSHRKEKKRKKEKQVEQVKNLNDNQKTNEEKETKEGLKKYFETLAFMKIEDQESGEKHSKKKKKKHKIKEEGDFLSKINAFNLGIEDISQRKKKKKMEEESSKEENEKSKLIESLMKSTKLSFQTSSQLNDSHSSEMKTKKKSKKRKCSEGEVDVSPSHHKKKKKKKDSSPEELIKNALLAEAMSGFS